MASAFKSTKKQPIVVACSMDFDRDEYLVRQAGRLAQQINLPVHLVHSLEPFKYAHWADSHLTNQDEIGGPSGNISRKALSGLNDLAELMRTAASVGEVTANVLVGPPADAIALEADAVNATLVVVGSADETRMLAGLSTTRELLGTCRIPVLIINDDCTTDFSGKNLSILIADSLHEDAVRPLKTAAQLSSKSERGRLIHAHIQDNRPGFVQRFLFSPLARMLSGNAPVISATQTVASLLARIKIRAREAGTDNSKPADYLPVVVTGDPQEKLLDLADKFSADIIVFGRHRMLHLDNMTLGRVSTAGMLSHRSAVMVVPA